ncbi:MAG: hypothetical protein LQ340_001409 [Diploschistes diacapsis]|nr:MAG: hypothetical protein LQ340_001409 [Diploschistes diacapsis]
MNIFPQPVRQPKARNAEITSRLSRLEKLVNSIGYDPNTFEKQPAQASSPESIARSSDSGIERGLQNLQVKEYQPISKTDGRRYLSSDFWSSLSGEVDGLRQLLNEASSDEDESESKSSRILTGEQGSPGPQLFYDPNQRLDLLTLHPPTAQMIAMGNIFFSRFDPVFKVLHRPSTLAFLYSATRDKKCITRGQEALLFAIYFAAITTVSDQDCINHFGQNKSILVQRYRSGIEAALPNANYLDTDDITVLQALVIYLAMLFTLTILQTSMRGYQEDRKPWTLFAIACRMAQSLELFTDGSLMNLPPFEVEMRRRLFWQLIVLDGAFSEIRGTPPIIPENSFDTQQPSNIYDEQLSPVAGIIGQAQEKGTEMTCSLLSQSASVIMQLYTAMNPRKKSILEETEASVEAREKVIQARLQELQTKYIDHCDLSVPILRISAEIGRIIILRIWLVTQRPMYTLRAQTTKPARREFVLAAAVSLLELVYGLENFPESAPWVWYYMAYVPWYPMAVILAELCIQTRGLLADRGWMIINKTYELWANRVADSKASSFWRPMKKLLDKAKTARLSNQSSQFSPELENQILQDWTMIGTLGGGAETQYYTMPLFHKHSVGLRSWRPSYGKNNNNNSLEWCKLLTYLICIQKTLEHQ